MVEGVHKGYTRELNIAGVGYRAQAQGQKLVLNVGYSHPIEYELPAGVDVEVTDGTKIKVSGSDKQQVGQAGARIRAFAPAEPYKGKGISYRNEQVRRKVGKTVA
jgi:large subunit ribosomal protein L6